MARDLRSLTSERHYMGTSSAGRFVSESDELPRYDRRPTAAERRRMLACAPAYRARYLREQNVLELVLGCAHVKAQIAAGQERLERLTAAREEAVAAGNAERTAQLEDAALWLASHLDQLLQRRRRFSQQLRALGISPEQEAAIAQEARRRTRAA